MIRWNEAPLSNLNDTERSRNEYRMGSARGAAQARMKATISLRLCAASRGTK